MSEYIEYIGQHHHTYATDITQFIDGDGVFYIDPALGFEQNWGATTVGTSPYNDPAGDVYEATWDATSGWLMVPVDITVSPFSYTGAAPTVTFTYPAGGTGSPGITARIGRVKSDGTTGFADVTMNSASGATYVYTLPSGSYKQVSVAIKINPLAPGPAYFSTFVKRFAYDEPLSPASLDEVDFSDPRSISDRNIISLSESRFVQRKAYKYTDAFNPLYFVHTAAVFEIAGSTINLVSESVIGIQINIGLNVYGEYNYLHSINHFAEIAPVVGTDNRFVTVAMHKTTDDALGSEARITLWEYGTGQVNMIDEYNFVSTFAGSDTYGHFFLSDFGPNKILFAHQSEELIEFGVFECTSTAINLVYGMTPSNTIITPVPSLSYSSFKGWAGDYNSGLDLYPWYTNGFKFNVSDTCVITKTQPFISEYGYLLAYSKEEDSAAIVVGSSVVDETGEEFVSDTDITSLTFNSALYHRLAGNSVGFTSDNRAAIICPYNKELYVDDTSYLSPLSTQYGQQNCVLDANDSAIVGMTSADNHYIAFYRFTAPPLNNHPGLRFNQRDDGAGTAQGSTRVNYTPRMGDYGNRIGSWGAW